MMLAYNAMLGLETGYIDCSLEGRGVAVYISQRKITLGRPSAPTFLLLT